MKIPVIATVACCIAVAQVSGPLRVTVRVVTVPVLVTTRTGEYLRDLGPEDFELFCNDNEQNVHMDYATGSLWRRISSVIEASLPGETGEASLSTFSNEVRLAQPLTANPALLDKAFGTLIPAGQNSRCLDAIVAAAKQLSKLPAERRRIILVIAQAGDTGTSATIRQAVEALARSNITFRNLPGTGNRDCRDRRGTSRGVSAVLQS